MQWNFFVDIVRKKINLNFLWKMEVVLVEQISKVELIVWWQICVKNTKIKGQKVKK